MNYFLSFSHRMPSKHFAGKKHCKPLRPKLLKEMLDQDPSEAAVQLGSMKGSLQELLNESNLDSERQRLLWQVIAHTCNNTGAAHTVIMLLTTLADSNLFNIHLRQYLIRMRTKNLRGDSDELQFLFPTFLTVFESMFQCLPSRSSDIKVSLTLMADVIGSLKRKEEVVGSIASQVDDFLKQISSFEVEKEQNIQLQRLNSSKPPPDDFREQSILPTSDELKPTYRPFLRPHIVKGPYPNTEHYLDVQFRLNKEDFIRPLREGIGQYLFNKKIRPDKRTKVNDVRIYEDVSLQRTLLDGRRVSYQMSFKELPHVRWETSKRLIFGSLVLLSDDDFKTYIPATVANREARDLARGLVEVCLSEGNVAAIVNKTFVMVESAAFFEAYRHVLLGLQKVEATTFPLAKYIISLSHDISPPAYLFGLQDSISSDQMPAEADSPVAVKPFDISVFLSATERSKVAGPTSHGHHELIGQEELQTNNIPSLFDRLPNSALKTTRRNCFRQSSGQKVRPVRHEIDIMNDDAWPSEKKSDLDQSQLDAVKMALTQELSIIQGPPGTGKTYIGLKIVHALLGNTECWSSDQSPGPILLVCYTNHALDQFLEGILRFSSTGIVRVGGRSKCESLESHNLKNLIKEERKERKIHRSDSRYLGQRAFEIRNEVKVAQKDLEKVHSKIQSAYEGIVSEKELMKSKVLLHRHYSSLLRMKKYGNADSWMVEWLVPDDLTVLDEDKEYTHTGTEAENAQANDTGTENARRNTAAEAETSQNIVVEDERSVIESQRFIDDIDDSDDDEPDEEKSDEHSFFPLNKLMTSKNWKKSVGKFVEKKLLQRKAMDEKAAKAIRDPWKLDIHGRWELYHYWVKMYLAKLESDIPVCENEYLQLCAELQELNDVEKTMLLRKSTVIGMTTTRAANEQQVLQRVKPKIIIVEEAAEVLESHIVTSLHASCQQLILIGDHQQLRPKPNVYQLATKYHLDVSLFERMVKNEFPFGKLEQQHRMRPEISKLMRDHFYPNLQDHESVLSYDSVLGTDKNVFFLDHSEGEASLGDTKSHYNAHEAAFITSMCKYFLKQDYEPSQITILTPYVGQLLKFREMMDKETFEGVKVSSVDNFQGEENDIILISFVRSNDDGKIGFLNISNRVCVSLSRARKGLFCLGNFSLYAEKSDLWQGILKDLESRGLLGKTMTLKCCNHPDFKTSVTKAEDFLQVPNGGCSQPCDTRLDCGHVCRQLCHPKDHLHLKYSCPVPCPKVCDRSHNCPLKCGEKCPPCAVKVEVQLPCGHTCEIKCAENPNEIKCKEKVEKTFPCSHKHVLPCHVQIHEVKCSVIVTRELECGHTKEEPCCENGKCIIVISKELPCGHHKSMQCHESTKPNILCKEIVEKELKCGHCKTMECYESNEPNIICYEMIDKELPCTHIKTMKCHESSKPNIICNEMVDKELLCGHIKTLECHESSKPNIVCNEMVEKELPCGHQKSVQCHVTDFSKIRCKIKVDKKLPCSHTKELKCYEETSEIQCKELVDKTRQCGHIVQELCHKKSRCTERVDKNLKCGHMKSLECWADESKAFCERECERQLSCGHKCTGICGDSCSIPCAVTVTHSKWSCGHEVTVNCSALPESCYVKCKAILECGHRCKGTCGKCFQGRYHTPCAEKCNRVLICGHACPLACTSPCLPCKQKCASFCHHSECCHPCGDPCRPCTRPCPWRCPHHQCTRCCCEPCNRPPCNWPCPRKLARCGHPCIGLCGETCPTLCMVCDRALLERIVSTHAGYISRLR